MSVEIEKSESNNYFDSYDNINVHNLMLRDQPRVQKYREAILNSKNNFKDKVIIKF
jgi:protein arginine N-methyltransferase 6